MAQNNAPSGKPPYALMIMIAAVPLMLLLMAFDPWVSPLDWREPINLQLHEDAFFEVENETMTNPFNGTHHDLVPGDQLELGVQSFTHYATRSHTSCSNNDNREEQECWTTYWDIFNLDVGGMNFSVEGTNGFKHTCFNALCNVTATVDGDEYWGLDMYGERVTITVLEYEFVRWCQGEEVCE